jgi:phage/plasmid-associated DNA primase
VETQTPLGESLADLLAQIPKTATIEKSTRPLKPVAVDKATETEATKLHRRVAAVLRTDAGAAKLFVELAGDDVRFDHSRRRWLIWEGHRWQPDADAAINRLGLDLAKLVRTASNNDALWSDDDDDQRKKLFGWGLDLDRRARHEALLAFAQKLKPIADDGKRWDVETGVAGAPNGVINLKTGELRDGDPDDRITKQLPVATTAHTLSPKPIGNLRASVANRCVRSGDIPERWPIRGFRLVRLGTTLYPCSENAC